MANQQPEPATQENGQTHHHHSHHHHSSGEHAHHSHSSSSDSKKKRKKDSSEIFKMRSLSSIKKRKLMAKILFATLCILAILVVLACVWVYTH